MSFSSPWLNERYRFDEAARNEWLELQCIHHFAHRPHLRLVDVGAGTGSNVRYYLERFPQDQEWTCVEQDATLCKALPEVVAAHARELDYEVEKTGEDLLLQGPGHEVKIRVRQGSLLDLEQVVDLAHTDLVTANAVFDLFSQEQFAHFAAQLARHRVSLLATVNYTGMEFVPAAPDDARVIHWYESHMEREQAFGRAMGKGGPEGMVRVLKAAGAQVHTADSPWEIGGRDTRMGAYLLGFMEEAIGELPLSPDEKVSFQDWLQEKRRLHEQSALGMQVRHEDVWALF